MSDWSDFTVQEIDTTLVGHWDIALEDYASVAGPDSDFAEAWREHDMAHELVPKSRVAEKAVELWDKKVEAPDEVSNSKMKHWMKGYMTAMIDMKKAMGYDEEMPGEFEEMKSEKGDNRL